MSRIDLSKRKGTVTALRYKSLVLSLLGEFLKYKINKEKRIFFIHLSSVRGFKAKNKATIQNLTICMTLNYSVLLLEIKLSK